MNQKRNWIGPYIPQGNLLRELVQQARLAYNLMLDARVHPVTKIIPLAALGYLFLPTDLAPDIVPLLGQVDDIAVVLFGLRLFFEFSPPAVVQEHLKRLAERIQGDWTVVDEPPDAEATSGGGEVVDDGPSS
jgi:uncharacterized membrane protein YkvA (DUF1232 family)